MQLDQELHTFLALKTYDESARYTTSRTLCSLTFEHTESIKILVASRNLTSAFGLFRLQFEALVRAMWLLYAASDNAVQKMAVELTEESVKQANKLPMLSEMLKNLEGKAPEEALNMLLEFKQYSWQPLSSFVHGGIHAINRHGEGYPLPLVENLLKQSNGVSTMVGMLLVILHGGGAEMGKIPKIQLEFADCLPETIKSRLF